MYLALTVNAFRAEMYILCRSSLLYYDVVTILGLDFFDFFRFLKIIKIKQKCMMKKNLKLKESFYHSMQLVKLKWCISKYFFQGWGQVCHISIFQSNRLSHCKSYPKYMCFYLMHFIIFWNINISGKHT